MNLILITYFSTESLKFVADFDIKKLDAFYSDCHSRLITTLKFRNLVMKKPPQSKETPNQQRKWQPNKNINLHLILMMLKLMKYGLTLSIGQSYKQKMNFHINKFNRNIQEKLRKLKSKNPKEYLNIINSLDRNNENSSIDLDTLYNFF